MNSITSISVAHSAYAVLFGKSGRRGYGADRLRSTPRALRYLAQFGWSAVTRVWTWVGASIVIWGLLRPDVHRMLSRDYWPSSIDNKWVLLTGSALLMWSCVRACNTKWGFAEQSTDSPCIEVQINRIDIGSLPCGCELVAHITVRNRGSDSQATDWQLRGRDNKGLSLTSDEAVQVKFEPMGGDLADHPIRRSQTRRGVVTFIVQGVSEAHARQITCWSLACRDGLNVRHESAAQYL
jgi:hypothetical protein